MDTNDDVNAVVGKEVTDPAPLSVMGAAVDGAGLGSSLQQTLGFPKVLLGQQNFPIPRS